MPLAQQHAGATLIVLKHPRRGIVTRQLSIPTIGIGAGKTVPVRCLSSTTCSISHPGKRRVSSELHGRCKHDCRAISSMPQLSRTAASLHPNIATEFASNLKTLFIKSLCDLCVESVLSHANLRPTIPELRAALRTRGRETAFCVTTGNLHEGHLR